MRGKAPKNEIIFFCGGERWEVRGGGGRLRADYPLQALIVSDLFVWDVIGMPKASAGAVLKQSCSVIVASIVLIAATSTGAGRPAKCDTVIDVQESTKRETRKSSSPSGTVDIALVFQGANPHLCTEQFVACDDRIDIPYRPFSPPTRTPRVVTKLARA